jgi:hypothetical protein
MVLMGAIFLGVAWWMGSDPIRLQRTGATAMGDVLRVTERESTGRNRGRTFCPEIGYTVGGTRHTFTGVCSNPAAYRAGDRVEVLYDRTKPNVGRINSFTDLWLFPVIFGCSGSLIFLVGLFIGVRALLRALAMGGLLAASIFGKNRQQ